VSSNAQLHAARRVLQTPKAFSNWFPVLMDMAREKVGQGPDTLTFRTRNGLQIECPNQPGARVPIYEIFAEDCYHFDWFLGSLAQRPIQVIDIGGQLGTFSCRLAQVHPQATIVTFEPSSTSAAFLRRNVEQNHFADRITVVEKALAATVGFAEFEDNEGGSGLNHLVMNGGGTDTQSTTRVETTTFDAAVASAAGTVELVKMDCEGGEYDLVYASSPANWAPVQRLVIEYHPVPGQSWTELRTWFEGVGLTVQHETDETSEGGVGVAWMSREPLPPLAV
jgi:FkbM family methyltransferase